MLIYLALTLAGGIVPPDQFITPPPPQQELQCEFTAGPLGLHMICGGISPCDNAKAPVGAGPPRRACMIVRYP